MRVCGWCVWGFGWVGAKMVGKCGTGCTEDLQTKSLPNERSSGGGGREVKDLECNTFVAVSIVGVWLRGAARNLRVCACCTMPAHVPYALSLPESATRWE